MKYRTLLIAAGLSLMTWQWGEALWIQGKAVVAQALLEKAWAKSTFSSTPQPPWPWADTWPLARLKVPDLHINQIVLAGASGRSLAFGPAHVSASARPGEGGTIILAGHRDTHFAFLRRLDKGMRLELMNRRGTVTRYRVSRMTVIDNRNTRIALSGRGLLILTTCYPFDALIPGGPLRYLVVAEKLSPSQQPAVKQARPSSAVVF